MKKYLLLDCQTALDIIYGSEYDGSIPVLAQIQLNLHVLFCEACTAELNALRNFKDVIQSDFFPPSPQMEEIIMERLYAEADLEEKTAAPAGFSIKSWVITGLIVLLSLTSPVLGLNFTQIAASEGSSFLLPIGLTIGLIVTCYGALFIGSHLEELSTRFGLR
jgi:hypothetical protein